MHSSGRKSSHSQIVKNIISQTVISTMEKNEARKEIGGIGSWEPGVGVDSMLRAVDR